MVFIAFVLRWSMRLIYALFAGIVLYFPTAELFAYAARELRFTKIPKLVPTHDALLPLLCLVLVYSVVAALFRKVTLSAASEKTVPLAEE